MNEEEQWRPINDYNNYSISSFCRIRNDVTGRILKPTFNGRGYLQVHLSKNGICKHFKLHRLVGIHFLPNWRDYKEIDHVNRNSLDNRIINLRWVSSSENNANRAKRTNTTSKFVGVSFDKKSNKWRAQIRCKILNGGIQKYLGIFNTEEQASFAREKYIKENNLEEFYNPKKFRYNLI